MSYSSRILASAMSLLFKDFEAMKKKGIVYTYRDRTLANYFLSYQVPGHEDWHGSVVAVPPGHGRGDELALLAGCREGQVLQPAHRPAEVVVASNTGLPRPDFISQPLEKNRPSSPWRKNPIFLQGRFSPKAAR